MAGKITPETERAWLKHWDKVLARHDLSMERGTTIPTQPKPHKPRPLRDNQSDTPAIECPAGKRLYVCIGCGHQQAMSPGDFVSGQPSPTCNECHGTIRRIKSPQAKAAQDQHNARHTSHGWANKTAAWEDRSHTPSSDPNERCPF